MKLGVFTDPHYALADRVTGTRRPRLSMSKLREALDAFRAAEVNAILCRGDWINLWGSREEMEARLREFASELRKTGLPVYTCMGNHDREVFSREEFEALTGAVIAPCTLEDEACRVILLDANFLRDGSPWPPHCSDWTQTALPDGELHWLAEKLNCGKTCLVALHQNLDPGISDPHRLENDVRVREVIRLAGNAPLVLQGHYHFGGDRMLSGTRYLTLPAMCEEEENSWLICTLSSEGAHCLCHRQPMAGKAACR